MGGHHKFSCMNPEDAHSLPESGGCPASAGRPRAESLEHQYILMSTELMTGRSTPGRYGRGSSVGGEIVRPMVCGKPRGSRALLERAGIQPVKVTFHFDFDLIQRCF